MATNAGGGYSRWRDLAVTRWGEDATCDNHGTFIYLRDRRTERYWSATYQPTLKKPDSQEAVFVQARAEYRRRDHGIEAHTEVCVSPEDDVEIRRLTLTNLSDDPREIEVTSYAEVVMAPQNADLAHRTFSNLFVQTEILPTHRAILCRRRPRTPDEETPWMFHMLALPDSPDVGTSYETDRARFIGRGRTAANPAALDVAAAERPAGGGTDLSNTEGSVLDPIVAIRCALKLIPDESQAVQVISGVAETREAAVALLGKYRDKHFVERAFEMAWFESQEVLRLLNMTETDAQIYGRLAGSVIYASAARRASSSIIARNALGQAGSLAFWHLRRSAHRPGTHRRRQSARRGEVCAAGTRLLAQQGSGGRPGDPQRGLLRLSGGPSGSRSWVSSTPGRKRWWSTGRAASSSGGRKSYPRKTASCSRPWPGWSSPAASRPCAEQVQRRVTAERLPPPLQTSRTAPSETIERLPAREQHVQ